jgi:hypothetical protein
LATGALFLEPVALQAQSDDSDGGKSLAQQYEHRLYNPGALVQAGAAAGIDQAMTNPYEWGGGVVGYGRRLGSALGTHMVRSSIHFALGKLLHEELDYHPSGKQGFGPRLKHALLSTVITRKTTTKQQTVAVGEISGIVGGGFVSRLWYPARFHSLASGLASAGIGFGTEAGMNVLREFWPEIRHPRRHAANGAAPRSGLRDRRVISSASLPTEPSGLE